MPSLAWVSLNVFKLLAEPSSPCRGLATLLPAVTFVISNAKILEKLMGIEIMAAVRIILINTKAFDLP
jgi:hypothetical protein